MAGSGTILRTLFTVLLRVPQLIHCGARQRAFNPVGREKRENENDRDAAKVGTWWVGANRAG